MVIYSVVFLPLLSFTMGCRVPDSWNRGNRGDVVAQYEQMREQQKWWDHQRGRAKYVAGRGWYLTETGQYYDGSGNVVGDASDEVNQASFQEEVEVEEPTPIVGDEPAERPLKQLGLRNMVKQIKQATGNGPDQDDARNLMREADQVYRQAIELRSSNQEKRQEKYMEAAELYASAAETWPDSAIEEEAMFKVAECYFFADELPEAEEQFEKLIEKFPNTRFLDLIGSRRFKISEFWLAKDRKEQRRIIQPNMRDKTQPRFDSFGHAVRLYDRIRLDDPAGGLADDATMAAANAFLAKGRYHKADELYSDLRDAFPDSEHQFEAHMLAIKCKLLIYQGPEYDSSPLEEAERLYKQMRRLYPEKYRQHSKVLDASYAELRARQAEQAWHFAKYFDRRGESAGAAHYYQQVVQEFPGTRIADESQQRLAELRDEPVASSSRLASLKGMLEKRDGELPPLRSDQVGHPDTVLR